MQSEYEKLAASRRKSADDRISPMTHPLASLTENMRDLTTEFMYGSDIMYHVELSRNLRRSLTPVLGPVSSQKLEGIICAIGRQDPLSLSKFVGGPRCMLCYCFRLYALVDIDLFSDSSCATCGSELHGKSRLQNSKRMACVLCSGRFCSNCASTVEFMSTFSVALLTTACHATCRRYIAKAQMRANPWHKCLESSKKLFVLESRVAKAHTEVCSRQSNFEGLVRFFAENSDRVPREDILRTMPELENLVKDGLSKLAVLLRETQSVKPLGRDEEVKRGLENYVRLLLTKIKAQFSLSQELNRRVFDGVKVNQIILSVAPQLDKKK